MAMSRTNPDKWELSCVTDEARNLFAIPIIQLCISKRAPYNIVDIGCGTGYISRCLLDIGVGAGSKWLLIDHDPVVLNYARKMFVDVDNVAFFESDMLLLSNNYRGERNDFAFICYSLLEICKLDIFMKGLNSLLCERAQVVVIYPDVLEDVEAASRDNRNIIAKYRSGLCIVNKINSFTEQKQKFFAHRIENIIRMFCEQNFYLSEIRSYITSKQKRHFALIFTRE